MNSFINLFFFFFVCFIFFLHIRRFTLKPYHIDEGLCLLPFSHLVFKTGNIPFS